MIGRIEIGFNRNKIFLMIFGSLVFIVGGAWLFFWTPTPLAGPSIFRNPAFIKIIGGLCVVFFGYTLFLYLQKLKDKTPALIVDNTGITDNSSGLAVGHIPWGDIIEIKTRRVFNQKFLMVIVRNPQDYISRQKSRVRKKLMQQNHRFYGSPISITANVLQTGFDEVENLLTKKFAEQKQA
jgi:hypothetical protein